MNMNLLKDPFISTTAGKVSLKEILTSEHDYQLQYFFDEIQLAMLQMLASLTTVVLKPTTSQLKDYLVKGVTEAQYNEALEKIETKWFDDDSFMQSKPAENSKSFNALVCNLVSGIESSSTGNASGLFSEMNAVKNVCPDCFHVLNYNLHMNIKADCFGSSGATGIRGGGALSTLISRATLRETLLANTIAIDFYKQKAQLDPDADERFMWDNLPKGDLYQAQKIGLERGLFALAYHIDVKTEDKVCNCDICGSFSNQIVNSFDRVRFTGSYGSKKSGREAGAGWWLHPYTPISIKDDGIYPVCARDQYWQSWQELTSFVIGKETEKATMVKAFIVTQFSELNSNDSSNLLVGGNIANQASIVGRVYDLYHMPSSLNKHVGRLSDVINEGITQKDNLSKAFKFLFDKKVGYDKNFVGGIKEQAMHRFTANAQQIIQQILLDVDRKEAAQLRRDAMTALNKEAKDIFREVQRKYQHDLPLFKALVKGEIILAATH